MDGVVKGWEGRGGGRGAEVREGVEGMGNERGGNERGGGGAGIEE